MKKYIIPLIKTHQLENLMCPRWSEPPESPPGPPPHPHFYDYWEDNENIYKTRN